MADEKATTIKAERAWDAVRKIYTVKNSLYS